MTFHILVGQRKCNYPGQYAQEALAVMDEIGIEDNHDFLINEQLKYEESGEFDALAVMRIFVPDNYVDEALYPQQQPIIDGLIL